MDRLAMKYCSVVVCLRENLSPIAVSAEYVSADDANVQPAQVSHSMRRRQLTM